MHNASSNDWYVKCFDSTKTKSFKVSDKELLKKYTQLWEKISSLTDKKFDSETVYGNCGKYIKTKIKSYEGNVDTNFQCKKISKENPSCKCLSLIMLNSVIKVNRYYPQTLLEECKYKIRKNKMENNINDGFDSSSSDESDNDPDSESNGESGSEPDCESKKPFEKFDSESKNPVKKSDNESKNPFKKPKNLFEKADSEYKNPFKKFDNASKNPFDKSDGD